MNRRGQDTRGQARGQDGAHVVPVRCPVDDTKEHVKSNNGKDNSLVNRREFFTFLFQNDGFLQGYQKRNGTFKQQNLPAFLNNKENTLSTFIRISCSARPGHHFPIQLTLVPMKRNQSSANGLSSDKLSPKFLKGPPFSPPDVSLRRTLATCWETCSTILMIRSNVSVSG